MEPGREAQGGGLVLVDKPAGASSFAVVKETRRRFRLKAGHVGTLDPFATGLLVCLLGRATRLARYLVGLDKRYVTEIRLGARTSTGDLEGEETERTDVPPLAAVLALRGEVELSVPAASAVKIGGERAYALHRRGIPVAMPTRRAVIHELEVVRFEPPLLELALRVSSGTYVRAIADALGGHCRALRRTAVGTFRVEDADEMHLLPPLAAVSHLARRSLSDEEVGRVRVGRAVDWPREGLVALVRRDDLVAVGRASGGVAHPETVIA